jgi:hypothetical protein
MTENLSPELWKKFTFQNKEPCISNEQTTSLRSGKLLFSNKSKCMWSNLFVSNPDITEKKTLSHFFNIPVVYILTFNFENKPYVKVGITSNLKRRLDQHTKETFSGVVFTVFDVIPCPRYVCDGSKRLENRLLNDFSRYRVRLDPRHDCEKKMRMQQEIFGKDVDPGLIAKHARYVTQNMQSIAMKNAAQELLLTNNH